MVPPSSSPARIPDWERGEEKSPSQAPGLVPSLRRLCGRRLLLAFLTGSERRGRLCPKCRPRAVASSSLRSSSPARIPDWEREEGKASSQAPGLVPSLPNDTMIRSFHNLFRVEKIAVSAWHLLQRPIPRPDRSFVLSWQKTLPMQSSVCRFGDVVEYVLFCYVYHCVFIRYISIKVPSVLRQQGCLL